MRALTLLCLLAGGLGLARAGGQPAPKSDPTADTPVLDRAELDRRLARTSNEAIVAGLDLWEKKNAEGCFRLYQGALIGLQPMLDHKPKLAALVKDRLDRAKDQEPVAGAFALREALDMIFAETKAALVAPKKAPLWERLGGEKAVRAVVHDFVEAAATDPKLDLTRAGKFVLDKKALARAEDVMVELVSEAGGGPLTYTGGNIPKALAGTKITVAEYNRLVGHLEAALKKNKVGAAEAEEVVKFARAVEPGIIGQ